MSVSKWNSNEQKGMEMAIRRQLQTLAWVFVLGVAMLPASYAAEPPSTPVPQSYGTIVGVVSNAAKRPLAGATVTAVRQGGGVRSTISGSDGVYSFADVPLGSWAVSATVEGFPDSPVLSVSVRASKANRIDLVLNIPNSSAEVQPALVSAPATGAGVAPSVPEALQSPDPAPAVDLMTPWADVGYVGWMNGTSRDTPSWNSFHKMAG